MTIREATRDDVPLIAAFVRELAAYEKLAHDAVATAAPLAPTLFGETRGAEVAIAELDGVPAGFALFFPNYSTFLGRAGIYLEDLFVRPEFRARGVGRALLAHLAGIALERGCGRLEWAVLHWNAPAIGFYETLGAEPMREWTTYRLSGDALARLAERRRD